MVKGICDYGRRIKVRLVEMDREQAWLIDEVKKKTGLYFDTSYLHKILTGAVHTPSICAAINDILSIEEA